MARDRSGTATPCTSTLPGGEIILPGALIVALAVKTNASNGDGDDAA